MLVFRYRNKEGVRKLLGGMEAVGEGIREKVSDKKGLQG